MYIPAYICQSIILKKEFTVYRPHPHVIRSGQSPIFIFDHMIIFVHMRIVRYHKQGHLHTYKFSLTLFHRFRVGWLPHPQTAGYIFEA